MDRNITDYLALREIPLNTLLTEITTNFSFANIGYIKEIHNENYIDVALYWNDNTGNEIVISDVRLLKIGTDKVKIFVKPEVGDNVLLICPKDFVEKLEFERQSQNRDFAQNDYSSINMCAILIKSESDDNVKTTVNIDENGNITISTDGDTDVNVKGDTTLNVDGDAKVDIGGDATVDVGGDAKLTADGDAEIDCEGATIKCSAASSLKVKLGETTAFEVGMVKETACR